MYSIINDNHYLRELVKQVLPEKVFLRLQNFISKIKNVES